MAYIMNSKSIILWILSVSVGVAMIGLGIIWPLLPVIATDIGAGGVLLGLIIASFNISRTVFSPFVGRYSDKYGRKGFIVVGLFTYALLSLGYLVAKTPEALIIVRLFHGSASLLVVPIALALAADIAPKGKLGAYMGSLNMAVMIGLGIGPTLGGVIRERFGMNWAFISMGGLAMLTCLLVLVCLPSDKISGVIRDRKKTASLREIFTHRIALAIILMRFFSACGQGAVYAFLPVFAMTIDMPGSQVGIILSANIFTIAFLQRPMGSLSDRISPRIVVIAGMFLSALSVLGIPVVEGFWPILALNFLMGISNGFILPGSLVITGQLGSSMGMASLMSVTDAAWSLGLIVSPLLSGLIMDVWGVTYVFIIGSAAIGIGSIVTTYLLFPRPPCPKKRRE